MAKTRTLNIWWLAYLIAVGEGLSFNITQILLDMILAFQGQDVDIPASVLAEAYDAVTKIATDPARCAFDITVNVGGVHISRMITNAFLTIIGAPKSKKFGDIRVVWA